MKKLIFIALLCLTISFSFHSKSYSQSKYGKITKEELDMTSYPQDTTATAVVLSKVGKTEFSYNELAGFRYEYTIEMKIKILKTEGTEFCTHEIFYTAGNASDREEIKGLSGTTYNMVDGKITKTKLSKEYIFEEEQDDDLKVKKFSLPNAKVGSVVEYKYTLVSPYTYNLRDFTFQEYIPVAYTKYEITIPEYFRYNRENQGYEDISNKTEFTNLKFNIRVNDGNHRTHTFVDDCQATRYILTGENISAMKSEPNLWTTRDYISKISFELQSFQFKHYQMKQYSTSWNDVDNRILESNSYGGNLKKESLFKNDVKSGDLTASNADAILQMVRSKVKWNKKSTFYPSNMNNALKNGLGSSSDINFLLINALKAAKFDAFPVALSTRGNGRIPMTHPSIVAFNYTITGVIIDDKTYYIDASDIYSHWNVLPEKTMVSQARILKKGTSKWTNLISNNGTQYIQSNYKFVDNQLEGDINISNRGNSAYDFRRSYFDNHKDKEDYIENLAKNLACSIENFDFENEQILSSDAKYSFTLKTDATLGDEYIYINPMLLKHYTNNPFKAEERKFPINFDYLNNYIQIITLDIPKGYAVEELPKSEKYVFGENNDLSLTYRASSEGDKIKIHYQYQLKTLMIPQTEYEGVRDFFAKVVLKNSEQIVLKKTE